VGDRLTAIRSWAVSGPYYSVRPARIAIEHAADRRSIRAGSWVEVREREPVPSLERITSAIPGHDRPGEEVVADRLAVHDTLRFEFRGRCGFATTYAYRSEP
jgi:hypothetical protein